MASQPAPEPLTDTPHFDLPPPSHPPQPPHLPSTPFAHQLPANPAFPSANTSTKQRPNQRASEGFRHPQARPNMVGANGNGPMPVPGGPHGRMGNGHAHGPNMRNMGFGGPRSPPNNKSTAHVPCKFYKQGTCQAGPACPFLHDQVADTSPCKYFTKGNCKFGVKCALAHVLPNGNVVNRGPNYAGAPHFGRVNIPPHHEPAPNSSLLSMQAHMAPHYPPPMQDEYLAQQQRAQYETIPTIDTTFTAQPSSNIGSPPNDSGHLPLSPVQKGLSVMDVPLPASFDSQGISNAARFGHMAASVPSKFLAESPPPSYQNESPALRNLHSSAFGEAQRSKSYMLGSSPPGSNEQPGGRRIMHSSMGLARRGVLSASVGARGPMHDDWEDAELMGAYEEDLLPSSLNDLLTPQEKMRRLSRDHGDSDGNSLSHRASLSRLGASPTMSDMKAGSPSGATSSPSRFFPVIGKPRANSSNESGEPGPLSGTSFGHVGSPLRNSSLHPGASPSLRALPRPASGEGSPFVSSPPRQASMSMISQQLSRTRISSRASEEAVSGLGAPSMHPGIARATSGSSATSGRLGMDRAISSSSIGRERIDEEQGLFSMEEEDLESSKGKDGASTTSNTSNKRLSGFSWGSGDKASPSLAPIGGHRAAPGTGSGRDTTAWANNA